jgi:hypothetical protein
MVVANEIKFEYYSIFDMSTDLLTKPLPAMKHTRCMQMFRLKKFDEGGVLSIDQIDLIHMLQISWSDKQNIVSLLIRDLEP